MGLRQDPMRLENRPEKNYPSLKLSSVKDGQITYPKPGINHRMRISKIFFSRQFANRIGPLPIPRTRTVDLGPLAAH